MGVAQMALGHLNQAINLFKQLLIIKPAHFATLNNLAAVYIRLNKKTTAATLLKQALQANPDDKPSQHMLAAIEHPTKATTCPEYARNLFDNYALYYDNHVQNYLNYTLPEQITALFNDLVISPIETLLDAGCGTGLIGAHLRSLCRYLIGVDISPKMLEHAKRKAIYDKLVTADIEVFLKNYKDALFDVIVAADVLPYLGDLALFFQGIKKTLKPEGYCILTTEISLQESWHLNATSRFSHNLEYLQDLCAFYQLDMVLHTKINARQQEDTDVGMHLLVLRQNL
tara:strand:- start:1302 stop:2156 length:855 start_codon:yes stop_codon:yes gene_type:complete